MQNKPNFKRDFGIWSLANLPDTDVHYFYNVYFDEIFRIGQEWYSVFVVYSFQGEDFALSLDMNSHTLIDLLASIRVNFSEETMKEMINRLADSQYRFNQVKWGNPISGPSFEAKRGMLHRNDNEEYVPFIVQKIF